MKEQISQETISHSGQNVIAKFLPPPEGVNRLKMLREHPMGVLEDIIIPDLFGASPRTGRFRVTKEVFYKPSPEIEATLRETQQKVEKLEASLQELQKNSGKPPEPTPKRQKAKRVSQRKNGKVKEETEAKPTPPEHLVSFVNTDQFPIERKPSPDSKANTNGTEKNGHTVDNLPSDSSNQASAESGNPKPDSVLGASNGQESQKDPLSDPQTYAFKDVPKGEESSESDTQEPSAKAEPQRASSRTAVADPVSSDVDLPKKDPESIEQNISFSAGPPEAPAHQATFPESVVAPKPVYHGEQARVIPHEPKTNGASSLLDKPTVPDSPTPVEKIQNLPNVIEHFINFDDKSKKNVFTHKSVLPDGRTLYRLVETSELDDQAIKDAQKFADLLTTHLEKNLLPNVKQEDAIARAFEEIYNQNPSLKDSKFSAVLALVDENKVWIAQRGKSSVFKQNLAGKLIPLSSDTASDISEPNIIEQGFSTGDPLRLYLFSEEFRKVVEDHPGDFDRLAKSEEDIRKLGPKMEEEAKRFSPQKNLDALLIGINQPEIKEKRESFWQRNIKKVLVAAGILIAAAALFAGCRIYGATSSPNTEGSPTAISRQVPSSIPPTTEPRVSLPSLPGGADSAFSGRPMPSVTIPDVAPQRENKDTYSFDSLDVRNKKPSLWGYSKAQLAEQVMGIYRFDPIKNASHREEFRRKWDENPFYFSKLAKRYDQEFRRRYGNLLSDESYDPWNRPDGIQLHRPFEIIKYADLLAA